MEDLLAVFNQFGVFGTIVVIIIYIIVNNLANDDNLLGKILTWIKKKMGIKPTKNINEVSDSDIINHEIFNNIDVWTQSQIPTLNFKTDFRNAVFKKYLIIFCKKYKEHLKEYVENEEYKNKDKFELKQSFYDLINKIVFDYERECTEVGIPKIVIEKMKIKNLEFLTISLSLISSLCDFEQIETENNSIKVKSILNVLNTLLENVIDYSEEVCSSINGELKGIYFEGIKE